MPAPTAAPEPPLATLALSHDGEGGEQVNASLASPRSLTESVPPPIMAPGSPVPRRITAAPDSPATPQIRNAFKVFDTDGNGTLSPAELKRILTRPVYGQPSKMSEADVDALIERYDANGDGELSVDEFSNAWGGLIGLGALEGVMTNVAEPEAMA